MTQWSVGYHMLGAEVDVLSRFLSTIIAGFHDDNEIIYWMDWKKLWENISHEVKPIMKRASFIIQGKQKNTGIFHGKIRWTQVISTIDYISSNLPRIISTTASWAHNEQHDRKIILQATHRKRRKKLKRLEELYDEIDDYIKNFE